MPVEGIKGFVKLTEIESGKTKVEMKTKIRIELYFFALVFFVIIIITGLLDEKSWPLWIYGLLPIGLLWFWWVYRIQEKGLFKRFKKYLSKDLKKP